MHKSVRGRQGGGQGRGTTTFGGLAGRGAGVWVCNSGRGREAGGGAGVSVCEVTSLRVGQPWGEGVWEDKSGRGRQGGGEGVGRQMSESLLGGGQGCGCTTVGGTGKDGGKSVGGQQF